MTKPAHKETEVVGPAVVTPLHRQDRELTKVAGSPKAWSKWTPHEAAFNQGRLSGGNGYTPEARFMAGQRYAEVWDAAQSAGRDSTQAQNISRGFGGGSISQAQSDAIKALVAIDSHMGQRDRIIIRMVCGAGYFPSEAVRLACGDYKDTVSARYREALDALVDAVEEARKAPGRVRV